MSEFVWEARSATGELRKGSMDADSEDAVENKLRAMKLVPTRVKKRAMSFDFSKIQIGSGVSIKDLVTFTRLFATMIDAGLPIVQCLEILAGQTDNKFFGGVLRDIKGSVEGGSTFSDALRRHPKIFDELYCNLVQAGEVGGILDTILNRLAVYNEKSMKLRRQLRGAMVYPSVVLIVFMGVSAILLGWVIPSFKNIFKDLGSPDDLPRLTKIVISVSEAFISWLPLIIVLLIGLAVGGTFFYRWKKGPRSGTRSRRSPNS